MSLKLSARMNHILSDWKECFDVLNQASVPTFSLNTEGKLTLSELTIFPNHKASSLVLLGAEIYPEFISFHFQDDLSLDLLFHWSEDRPAQLSCISFGSEDETDELSDNGFFDLLPIE